MAQVRSAFRDKRKMKGLTQAKLASLADKSTVYIRMIENGTFTPGRDTMFLLASILDSTVEELFSDYFAKLHSTPNNSKAII